MRVVDAEGRFVGFVREIAGQNLVIGRPAAADIQVPMATCQMSADWVKLSLYGDELARLGQNEQDDQDPTRYGL
jgi:hypothetical protein